MGAIWRDHARKIVENGVFIANDGSNWDLWEHNGIVYSIPVEGSGCDASVWRWFGTSTAVPGPLPGYPRQAALFDSGFARSCRAAGLSWAPGGGLFLIGWRLPGWSRER